MEDNNNISQDVESQSSKSPSRTDEVALRKKIILNFLKRYKKKSYDHSHITDDFYNKIKKNGLTISQLYEIMCRTPATKRTPTTREINNVNYRVIKPLLSKTVSIDNFKKNVKSLDYTWDSKGYLRKTSDDIKFEYAKQLYLYVQQKQKSSISIFLEEIPYTVIKIKKKHTTDKNSTSDNIADDSTNTNDSEVTQQSFKYCISIYFKDNLDLDAIASLLYRIFSDSILGITVGFGMIQVHCKFPNKAKTIIKNIQKIFNDGIYAGYYLYK